MTAHGKQKNRTMTCLHIRTMLHILEQRPFFSSLILLILFETNTRSLSETMSDIRWLTLAELFYLCDSSLLFWQSADFLTRFSGYRSTIDDASPYWPVLARAFKYLWWWSYHSYVECYHQSYYVLLHRVNDDMLFKVLSWGKSIWAKGFAPLTQIWNLPFSLLSRHAFWSFLPSRHSSSHSSTSLAYKRMAIINSN